MKGRKNVRVREWEGATEQLWLLGQDPQRSSRSTFKSDGA